MNRRRKLQLAAWKERLDALKNLPPILRILWQSGSRLMTAAMSLRALIGVLPFATLWIAKRIVDLIVTAIRHPQPIPHEIWYLLAAEFTVGALGAVLSRGIHYCDGLMAERFSRELTLRVMEHASTLDLESFEDPAFYDKLDRARIQACDRVGMLHSVGTLFQQSVTLISLSAGIIVFSPWLFALIAITIFPAFIGESHFAFVGYALAYSLTPLRRELDYLRDLGTKKEGAKELKVFGLASFLSGRFTSVSDEVIHRNRRMAGRRFRTTALLALVASLGYYGAYVFLVLKTFSGDLTIGTLTLLSGSLAGCSNQIQLLFGSFAVIAEHALFLTDLVEFFAAKPRIQSIQDSLPAPRPIRQGFEFRKVSFAYRGSRRLVLDNIDLRIGAGERIALVGENGQGKTTLVKLLTRLYEPTSGQILLDGVDLRDYDVEDLRREIGVIFQDFMRYDLTVRENITMGGLEVASDADRLGYAVRKSGAHELIERLPHGLDQMLGRRFEDGVDLSGGEWQKFALARMYMRDAGVLILDEPAAALDPIAEYEVFKRFAELTEGKIALLISHRFSTVRMADRIIVLHNGTLHEEGTHQQLMARKGRYAGMFELQASSYK
jgi:ATP-binding cassette subfamily B protein